MLLHFYLKYNEFRNCVSKSRAEIFCFLHFNTHCTIRTYILLPTHDPLKKKMLCIKRNALFKSISVFLKAAHFDKVQWQRKQELRNRAQQQKSSYKNHSKEKLEIGCVKNIFSEKFCIFMQKSKYGFYVFFFSTGILFPIQ